MKNDKRKKMIYDASCIEYTLMQNASRTGVYMVVYHLLKSFLECDRLEIVLYTCGCPAVLRQALESCGLGGYSLGIVNEYQPGAGVLVRVCDSIYKKYIEFRNAYPRKRFLLWPAAAPAYLVLRGYWSRCLRRECDSADIYFSPETKELPREVLRAGTIEKHAVLHDLMPILFPEYYPDNRQRVPVEHLLEQMNEYCIYGWANSCHTRKDFGRYVNRSALQRITPIRLACSAGFRPNTDESLAAKVREKYHIPAEGEYVFSLCSLEPRKNLIRVIRTFIEFIKRFEIDDFYFVLGGGSWDIFVRQMEEAIGGLGEYGKYIIKAGYVADEDLPVLYSGAKWFVYTSQYEGFGLPPLEAMHCGCPVITSNNTSLPEVVGEAGIMIDWDDDEAHIRAYQSYYFDEELRQENIRKGVNRAKEFAWDVTAGQILDSIC